MNFDLRSMYDADLQYKKKVFTSPPSLNKRESLQCRVENKVEEQLFATGVYLCVPCDAFRSIQCPLRDVFHRAEFSICTNEFETIDARLNELFIVEKARLCLDRCADIAIILRQIGLHRLIVDTILSFYVFDDKSATACLLFKNALKNSSAVTVFADIYFCYRPVVCIPLHFSISQDRPLYKPTLSYFNVSVGSVVYTGSAVKVESIVGKCEPLDRVREGRFSWQLSSQSLAVGAGVLLGRTLPIYALLFCIYVESDAQTNTNLFHSVQVAWNGDHPVNVDYNDCFLRQCGQRFWFALRRESDTQLFDEQPVLQHESCSDTESFINRYYTYAEMRFTNHTFAQMTVWVKHANLYSVAAGLGGYWFV